jgi:hypothetical protein
VAIFSLEGSSISVLGVLGHLHCSGTLAVVWCMAIKSYMHCRISEFVVVFVAYSIHTCWCVTSSETLVMEGVQVDLYLRRS